MILLKNISKSFGHLVVIDDFTLEISGITCIMSESGAGKTTLINILLGLEKQDCGEIENLPESIGVTFQEDRLFDHLTAFSNIKLACKGVKAFEIHKLLEKFNINENQLVKTLSGGQKRRVAIARSMLFDAQFLILDEPFNGIDEKNKQIIIDEIMKLDKTVLIITHNPQDVEKLGLKKAKNCDKFNIYKKITV